MYYIVNMSPLRLYHTVLIDMVMCDGRWIGTFSNFLINILSLLYVQLYPPVLFLMTLRYVYYLFLL